MSRCKEIQQALRSLGDKEIAQHSRKFFKTARGEYGEGDQFIGVRVPVTRKIANTYKNTPLIEIEKLLSSKFHEERLLAVIMLANVAKTADEQLLKTLYQIYIKNSKYINNWDIVDSSAPHIVGKYLYNNNRSPLYKFARSRSLWEKRISIISTLYFIKQDDYTDTLAIAEILLNDSHDLIHKACGWMLREVGNRNIEAEEAFLRQHYQHMPRTMLRYAIEKFPEVKRQKYLRKF